jgi:hypothetical protein
MSHADLSRRTSVPTNFSRMSSLYLYQPINLLWSYGIVEALLHCKSVSLPSFTGHRSLWRGVIYSTRADIAALCIGKLTRSGELARCKYRTCMVEISSTAFDITYIACGGLSADQYRLFIRVILFASFWEELLTCYQSTRTREWYRGFRSLCNHLHTESVSQSFEANSRIESSKISDIPAGMATGSDYSLQHHHKPWLLRRYRKR